MNKPKILVTRRWPDDAQYALLADFDVTFNETDKPMSREQIRSALMEYDGILCTVTDDLKTASFEGLRPRVKILANYGVGYSHIDIGAAKAAGIVVTNTPDVLSDCTADLAMTLLLMAARRTGEGERELRSGNWSGWRPTHLVGTKVTGKTLGIVGFGRIGQEVAKRAHFGFGMRILAQSRSKVPDDVLASVGAVQVKTLDELLTECDFVSLHCPGGDANRQLINARSFDLMKSNAILVNTARGEVVDEAALAAALNSGKISGAGLDVYEQEPIVHPDLLACESAVLLPHLGSSTNETRTGMGMMAIHNLQQFYNNKSPLNRVI